MTDNGFCSEVGCRHPDLCNDTCRRPRRRSSISIRHNDAHASRFSRICSGTSGALGTNSLVQGDASFSGSCLSIATMWQKLVKLIPRFGRNQSGRLDLHCKIRIRCFNRDLCVNANLRFAHRLDRTETGTGYIMHQQARCRPAVTSPYASFEPSTWPHLGLRGHPAVLELDIQYVRRRTRRQRLRFRHTYHPTRGGSTRYESMPRDGDCLSPADGPTLCVSAFLSLLPLEDCSDYITR